nr:MAG TPA: hypothetical protein [Caudoviricetes sp.]
MVLTLTVILAISVNYNVRHWIISALSVRRSLFSCYGNRYRNRARIAVYLKI